MIEPTPVDTSAMKTARRSACRTSTPIMVSVAVFIVGAVTRGSMKAAQTNEQSTDTNARRLRAPSCKGPTSRVRTDPMIGTKTHSPSSSW